MSSPFRSTYEEKFLTDAVRTVATERLKLASQLLTDSDTVANGAHAADIENLALGLMDTSMMGLTALTNLVDQRTSHLPWMKYLETPSQEAYDVLQRVFKVAREGMPWFNPKLDIRAGVTWEGPFIKIRLAPDFILALLSDGKKIIAEAQGPNKDQLQTGDELLIEFGTSDTEILGGISEIAGLRTRFSGGWFTEMVWMRYAPIQTIKGSVNPINGGERIWTNPCRTAFLTSSNMFWWYVDNPTTIPEFLKTMNLAIQDDSVGYRKKDAPPGLVGVTFG